MIPPMTDTIIWPTLRYRDAPAAIRFLVDAFGFQERARHPGETEDSIAHAELRGPSGGGIMLGSARDDGLKEGLPPGVGSVYVVTDDPDAVHDRAVAAGAAVVRPPQDTDYGSRECTVRDPEGVFWSFGTYRGA